MYNRHTRRRKTIFFFFSPFDHTFILNSLPPTGTLVCPCLGYYSYSHFFRLYLQCTHILFPLSFENSNFSSTHSQNNQLYYKFFNIKICNKKYFFGYKIQLEMFRFKCGLMFRWQRVENCYVGSSIGDTSALRKNSCNQTRKQIFLAIFKILNQRFSL